MTVGDPVLVQSLHACVAAFVVGNHVGDPDPPVQKRLLVPAGTTYRAPSDPSDGVDVYANTSDPDARKRPTGDDDGLLQLGVSCQLVGVRTGALEGKLAPDTGAGVGGLVVDDALQPE